MTRQLRSRGVSGGRAMSGGVLLLLWLGAHGCSDDQPPKYATPRDRDSGSERDSGADAGDRDGGDAQVEPEPDGGGADGGDGGGAAGDAGPEPVDPCELSAEDNTFLTMTPGANEGRFSLTTGTTGFGVAFEGPATVDCDTWSTIQVLPVQSSGAFAMPTTVIGDCVKVRELSLLRVAQGWRMVWIDNSADSTELQTMLLDDTMSGPVGDLRTTLTTNQLLEERPVLANVGGVPLVALLVTDTLGSEKTRVSTLRLDGQASMQDVVPEDADRKPIALSLAQIGAADAVLAWADASGKPGVWAQRLDLTGAAKGEPKLVTDATGGTTTVDLAPRSGNEGGALIYSTAVGGVNNEVRFRRLSSTGEFIADQIKVVSRPFQGRDASIARLGAGYVVAYRALPGGPITQNEIRLAFLTPEGDVARNSVGEMISYKVADSGAGGGRTTVRVSNDGQLLIGYIDTVDSQTVLRLVRRRLDCSL